MNKRSPAVSEYNLGVFLYRVSAPNRYNGDYRIDSVSIMKVPQNGRVQVFPVQLLA